MTYQKTTWVDRQVQYPLTYTFSSAANGGTTLTPNEGTVSQAGTPINASNMNNIENGVAALDTQVTTNTNNITSIQTTLTTKANQSDMDSITSRMTTAESNISNNATNVTNATNSINTINGTLPNKLNKTGDTMLGSLLFDVSSGEKDIKTSGSGFNHGFYLASTKIGMYDWQNNRTILSYNATTGTLSSEITNVTFPTNVNANNFIEGGTALSGKYATKVHTHLTADVTDLQPKLDAKMSVDGVTNANATKFERNVSGENVLIKNSVDDGTTRFITTGAANYIQSGRYDGTTPKQLTISGVNSTALPSLLLNATTTNTSGDLGVGGNLTASGSISEGGTALASKYAPLVNSSNALWTGASYPPAASTITPTKPLSQCRNGWIIIWSDFTNPTANNYDFFTSVIPKYYGSAFNGCSHLFVIPTSFSSTTTSNTLVTTGKRLYIFDDHIVGHDDNGTSSEPLGPKNVVIRAVIEW